MLTASPSLWIDSSQSIILDTSAAINLNATGYLERIVEALPSPVAVTEILMIELKRGLDAGYSDFDSINGLLRQGQIDVIGLCALSEPHFESLVIGPATETLDDGEAATIAQAIALNAIPVIDERKANRLCATRYPDLGLASSLDILLQPSVTQALGLDGLRQGTVRALQVAKMQIPRCFEEWIVGFIGFETASGCSSLPRHLLKKFEGDGGNHAR